MTYSQMPPAYTYQPPSEQNHTRLLLARCWNRHCSAKLVMYLLDKPEYANFSYTWGSPELNHRIQIDGSNFFIGSSLDKAL